MLPLLADPGTPAPAHLRAYALGWFISDYLQWARTEAARTKDTKPSLPLEKYAGKYGGDLYGDVAVAAEDGKLVLRFVPAPAFVADLDHWHHDTFRVKWRALNPYIPDGWATFVLDRRGKPAELRVDCPNEDFD